MMTLFFNAEPVTDWPSASRVGHGALRPLFLGA